MELIELLERVKRLSTNERYQLLVEMLRDEQLSVTELILAKVSNLEQFKHDAKRDIVKVAEAGMELGEREMRRVTKINGNTRKKDDKFYLAMVKCLLEAGAFSGTKYGDEISASDFGSIDKDWYEWAWRPKTGNQTKEDK